MFKKPYLISAGFPPMMNGSETLFKFGRSKMNGFGQVLNQQQVDDLLAYMHTL